MVLPPFSALSLAFYTVEEIEPFWKQRRDAARAAYWSFLESHVFNRVRRAAVPKFYQTRKPLRLIGREFHSGFV